MENVLWLSFQKCLGLFVMLLVEVSFETLLFRHLSNHVFGNPSVQKYIRYEGHLFFQNVQNWIYISKMHQKCGKMFFCYWDNWIWRCCNKLSLLRREYLLSGVNVLTNSPKILHITQRESFSKWIPFRVINKYGKGAGVHISTVFRVVYYVPCRGVL